MNYYDWESAILNPSDVKRLQIYYNVHQDYSLISKFEQLEYLQLYYFPYYAFPDSLAELSSLKTLKLYDKLDEFPLVITRLSALTQLYLIGSGLKELPSQLTDLQHLTLLHITGSNLNSIPAVVFDLPNLKDLSFENSPIESLDANVIKAKSLQNLDLSGTKIKTLPDEFAWLNLSRLSLSNTPFFKTIGIKQRNLVALLKQFKSQDLSLDERKLYFLAFLGSFSKIEKIASEADMLGFLNNSNREVRFQTLQFLHQKYPSPFLNEPPECPRKICFVGKKNISEIADLSEKLKNYNYLITNKLDKSVDWAILGELPKKGLETLLKNQIKWTTISHFKDYYQTIEDYYLTKQDPETTEIARNLLSLLHSNEETNQLLALEMVLGGGINDLFLNEILLFYLWNPNTKTRNLAEQILQKFLPSQSFMSLKNNVRKWYNDPSDEMIMTYLQNIQTAGFAIETLSLHFYRKTGKIKAFCLSMPKSFVGVCQDIKAYNVLGLANLKLKNLLTEIENFPEIKFLYLQKNALQSLPVEIKTLSRLVVLNLAQNHFTGLPEVIFQLEKLEELDLSSNKIVQVPAAIGKLTRLKYLNLSDNKIKSFPDEISLLQGLKSLDLRNNPLAHQRTKISALLPNCNILFD
jgi:Leucine-rich repeat (LRR) protein